MKKSVVIVIGLIYVMSLFLVTLFGIKHKTFNEVHYVEQVEIIDNKAEFLGDGSKFIRVYPDENGICTYQLNWKVTPENATNPNVDFIYDHSKQNLSIDENGLVTYVYQDYIDVVTITIRSADGTKREDTIKLMFIKS